jgi:5-methylcytosine-specific restriction endonuclease McrA
VVGQGPPYKLTVRSDGDVPDTLRIADVSEKSEVLATVCDLLAAGDRYGASSVLRRDYPFAAQPAVERRYGEAEALRVFLRDGFRDRYSGACLIFPGTLRVLSLHLPADFPFHPNWKMSQTHFAFWELSPTVDHVIPVSRGGADVEENWVTTSMVRNSAKANWTLEELGWRLHPPGGIREWDGLLRWFRGYVTQHPDVLENPLVRRWHRAALATPAV